VVRGPGVRDGDDLLPGIGERLHRRVRGSAEVIDLDVAVAIRVVHVEAARVLVVRREGDGEQAPLAARGDEAGDVEERPDPFAVAQDDDPAGALRDEQQVVEPGRGRDVGRRVEARDPAQLDPAPPVGPALLAIAGRCQRGRAERRARRDGDRSREAYRQPVVSTWPASLTRACGGLSVIVTRNFPFGWAPLESTALALP
jgi:hypothetical protein